MPSFPSVQNLGRIPDLPAHIDLAVSWAHRLPDLAALRGNLRDQMRTSPLMNAPQFAQDFLDLLESACHHRQPPLS